MFCDHLKTFNLKIMVVNIIFDLFRIGAGWRLIIGGVHDRDQQPVCEKI